MQNIIHLDDKKVIIKKYRVRSSGRKGSTLETSISKEAFGREARRKGLTFEEALDKIVAVWCFNDFGGLHLSFEPAKKEEEYMTCRYARSRNRPSSNHCTMTKARAYRKEG
jgi:hypothetical protein